MRALFLTACTGPRGLTLLGQDGLVLAHGPVEAEEAAAQPGGIVADA